MHARQHKINAAEPEAMPIDVWSDDSHLQVIKVLSFQTMSRTLCSYIVHRHRASPPHIDEAGGCFSLLQSSPSMIVSSPRRERVIIESEEVKIVL